MENARSTDDIGKLIKYHRERKSLTQKEFAKKCGLTQVTISNIENGIGGSLKALSAILGALKMELTFKDIQKIDRKNMTDYLE